jgi:hypothetical protein
MSTSCVCGYANPSDNCGDGPNTLRRSLGSDRGEAGDILEDDIPGDVNRVAGNLEDGFRVVCGLVHDRLQEVEFQAVSQSPVGVLPAVSLRQVVEFPAAVFPAVSRHQAVVVRGVLSQEAGSVDYRRQGPFQAWQEVARQSVDDSSKNHPQRHLLLVAYSDDQG